MARVTVEDCVKLVSNRFDLVLLAAKRTRDIFSGAPITVERNSDKNPVIALREIALQTVSTNDLHEAVVRSLQKNALFQHDQEFGDIDQESQELLNDESAEWKNSEDITGLHIEQEDELDLEEDVL